MNLKGFFVASLSSALDLGIATPDDLLRHVTPDVLAKYLPRPLWARLLTACVGAPKVDAQLVVETIGVPNLCEHIPTSIMWACINEIAQRALAGIPATPIPKPFAAVTPPSASPTSSMTSSKSQPIPLATPPPPAEKRVATPPRGSPLPSVSIPKPTDALSEVVAALESDSGTTSPAGRSRTPTGQRFRQSSTGIGRLAATNNATAARRPQAAASPPPEPPPAAAVQKPPRRGHTEADAYESETDVKDDWKNALVVDDEQLVDWTASEETLTVTEDYNGNRKR